MERKVGYLKFKRSKGNFYVYLVKSVRDNGVKKDIVLYRFGRLEKALENLYDWRMNYEKTPKELLNFGYEWHDLHEWVNTLEMGYSKTGRKLIIAN